MYFAPTSTSLKWGKCYGVPDCCVLPGLAGPLLGPRVLRRAAGGLPSPTPTRPAARRALGGRAVNYFERLFRREVAYEADLCECNLEMAAYLEARGLSVFAKVYEQAACRCSDRVFELAADFARSILPQQLDAFPASSPLFPGPRA